MALEAMRGNRRRYFFADCWKIAVGVSAVVMLILPGCASSVKCNVPKAESKIYLTGDGFSAWNSNTGDWQVVGETVVDPQNEKLLAVKPGNGVIVNGPTGKTVNLVSKAEFGDVRAHVEFMISNGSNSGVYFAGQYEIQILDSWGVEHPKYGDCGGIYERWDENREPKGYEGYAPLVNASRKPGEWQSFDVIFHPARFDESGKKVANARFEKVIHNNIVIHDNVEVSGPTRGAAYSEEKAKGPILLQGDHGPAAYRNIWIIPLEEQTKK